MSRRACRVCFERIQTRSIITLFDSEAPVCDRCLKGFERRAHRRRIEDFYIWCLGGYGGPLKDLLIRYKMQGDYELHSIFLYPFSSLISCLFSGYMVACAPSSPEAVSRRGFDHMDAIASSLNLRRIVPFKKMDGPDQKDLTREGRLRVGERIVIDDPDMVAGRWILLLDDVISTGATLVSCRRLLLDAGARRVSVLAIMDNDDSV